MTLDTGTVVAGYRIEALVGSGSSGSVYTAEDPTLGRRIALKILAPDLSRDERFRERFLRESRVAAALEHPNVVPIHAAGETEDGQLYLAMRYVDGRDLSALIKGVHRLDPERAVVIVTQIASALDAAHVQGLIHRDVKPANILITRHGGDEHAYLCDFGLAKHASTVSSLTGDRAVVGTVEYLAPEQIAGKPVDGRADVYALGCVLYECLTGEPPFRRDNELASLLAHVNDPASAPSERVADLSEAFDGVVARALAKDRDERYATAGELAEAARAALAGEAVEPSVQQSVAQSKAAVRTFLFADVRGYTAYTREHGDEAGAALAARFAEIVRELAPGYDGHLQELRGDEALVVFDSARQALRFAIALSARATADLARPIGIGLDAGEAVPVEEGFRGSALNRAARLCSLAKPGEVLATDAVVELAGKVEGVAVGFRRVERVKGFDKPVGVVDIHAPEDAPRHVVGRRIKRTALGNRPGRRLAALGVLALVGVVALAWLTLSGTSAPAANSITALDGESGDVNESFDAGGEFQQIVKGDDVLYGLDFDGGVMATIDPKTAKITERTGITASRPSQVAPSVAYDSIWAADERDSRVLRFDPRAPGTPIVIKLPNPTANEDPQWASGIAVTKHGIWASYGTPQRVARIDPATNRVTFSRKLEGAALYPGTLLTSDGDTLWAVQRDARRTWRLDPTSGDTLVTGKIGDDNVSDAAVEGGFLWVGLETSKGVWKVDDRGTVVEKVETGELPWAVLASGGSLWVTNANGGTVSRVDPASDETVNFDVGHRPLGVAVADGRTWVSLGLSADDAQARIVGSRIITAVVPGDSSGGVDLPAASESALAVREATGARLMQYTVSANGQAALVPELAKGPPTVSKDGLTYTFTVRRGFRFSPPSDEEVTAESLRYSIERARKFGDYCPFIFHVIKKIETHGDRMVFTLSAPSGDLAARLAHPCASAVPAGTPGVLGGLQKPVPSAGPYYPDTVVHGQQLVLLRNPNYGGKRPQHLDAIVLQLGLSADDGAEAVERGKADLVVGDVPVRGVLAPGGPIDAKHGESAGPGQRWFGPPSTLSLNIQLNYAHGPLRDRSLRRAISLALDRRALSGVGGTPLATMIPPGIPGHIATSPADVRPAVARARALVRGRHVALTMIILPDFPEAARIAELVKRDLSRVGISVEVRTDPDRFRVASDPAEGIDLLPSGWAMDIPDPANAVSELLGFAAGMWGKPEGGDDPPWLQTVRAAERITGPARTAAFRRLDRRISRVDVPMVVHTAAPGHPVFFSERVGCQHFLPLWWGFPDLASLCLKD